MNFSPKALLALALLANPADAASSWEAAPFMNEPPFGLDSTHTFGFSLRGKAYAITGNLRVPKFDYCGDCRGAKDDDGNPVLPYSTYTDAFYTYDPMEGWQDLGSFPNGGFNGARGFSQGDIMARGTPDEILYWGLGQSRHLDADGNDLNIYPRWDFNEDKTVYSLVENKTNYPRLTDWWSFDGTDWKQLADFPGIGRTHPAVAAANGKVVVGLGFGELCPSEADPCTATSHLEDPRGRSGNLQDAHVYDVAKDTWDSSVEPFPYPAHHPMHFGLEGPGGGLFFVAGHNGAKVHNRAWKLVEASTRGIDSNYNYVWEEVAAVPGLGRVAGTQFDHGGFGYMMGGETAANKDNRMPGFGNAADYDRDPTVLREDHRSMDENEVWRYDPEAGEWAQLPSTPDDGSRWAGSNFVLDNYLYCFQGVNRKGHYQFNNFTMTWPTQGWRLYLPNATALIPATTVVEDEGITTAPESSANSGIGRFPAAATVAALSVTTLL